MNGGLEIITSPRDSNQAYQIGEIQSLSHLVADHLILRDDIALESLNCMFGFFNDFNKLGCQLDKLTKKLSIPVPLHGCIKKQLKGININVDDYKGTSDIDLKDFQKDFPNIPIPDSSQYVLLEDIEANIDVKSGLIDLLEENKDKIKYIIPGNSYCPIGVLPTVLSLPFSNNNFDTFLFLQMRDLLEEIKSIFYGFDIAYAIPDPWLEREAFYYKDNLEDAPLRTFFFENDATVFGTTMYQYQFMSISDLRSKINIENGEYTVPKCSFDSGGETEDVILDSKTMSRIRKILKNEHHGLMACSGLWPYHHLQNYLKSGINVYCGYSPLYFVSDVAHFIAKDMCPDLRWVSSFGFKGIIVPLGMHYQRILSYVIEQKYILGV